jgi:hypothetical protein
VTPSARRGQIWEKDDGHGACGILTLGIVLVREVIALLRTRHIGAPEEAAAQTLPQAGDVDVAWHAALLKGLGEVGVIDAVVEDRANEDREVVVPVCDTGSALGALGDGLRDHGQEGQD